jgi:hypothetical protein
MHRDWVVIAITLRFGAGALTAHCESTSRLGRGAVMTEHATGPAFETSNSAAPEVA